MRDAITKENLTRVLDLFLNDGFLPSDIEEPIRQNLSLIEREYKNETHEVLSFSTVPSSLHFKMIIDKTKVTIEILVTNICYKEYGFIQLVIDTRETEYYISDLRVSHMFIVKYPPQKLKHLLNYVAVRKR